MATKKTTVKKKRAPRRKKVAKQTQGLTATEVSENNVETAALEQHIVDDGGHVLGRYRDPLGGHGVVLASLPIEKVQPTLFQRDRSETHVKKLAKAMERVGYFLDPVISVRENGTYFSPNGNHRLGALELLGAKSVVSLVLPDADVAFQILALNTEKAHNLKERSLEAIRMARALAKSKNEVENSYAAIFEEPHFLTFGICYEKRPRFSAGAYSSFVKRLEGFFEVPLSESLEERDARAQRLLDFDDAVGEVVAQLKQKGFTSPYLKAFVVARVNFLRFVKSESLPDFDETLDKFMASVKKFNTEKVKQEDIGKMAFAGGGESDE